MIPGLEMLACQDLAVPMEIMEHVVRVESSFNPYAIGVVGARLERQPRSLEEAVATAAKLERDGYNFSLGLAQVNRHNLAPQGLASYELAFAACPNLAAGARILADCHARAGRDWGKAFSCYYSGNFSRGFRDGYVEKIRRSMAAAGHGMAGMEAAAIPIAGGTAGRHDTGSRTGTGTGTGTGGGLVARRAAAADVAPAAAALPDPPMGSAWIPVADGSPEAVARAVEGSGAGDSDGPFVPRVSLPGAGSRSPRQPAPQAAPSPAPSPSQGRLADSAFVF